ncbi:DUF819 family protein [uncultured Eudoraea sp.]|uniref:DUF819 family protein n=1 Tax=uncultured Eudoraea sp. TaxID=1035614 RepID=UPI002628BB16|nr:DUF819 family protein [uncultured Eudoraea sp.]
MSFIENPVYVLGVLCLMVILADYISKTKIGKKLGAALLVILFTAVVANLGLIPSASNSIPLYDGIFTYLAPISIFYLLLGVNLNSIKKAGAPMIILFLIGSLATTLGVLIAWYLISPQDILGEDGKIIAGMLTGTYTGGSVNFNAVALEFDFQERGILYAGTIAVDNVITTIWIIVTISFPAILRTFWKDKKVQTAAPTLAAEDKEHLNFHSLIWLLFLGIFAYYISELITNFFPQIPSILTLSTIGILLAQTRFVQGLKGNHFLGLYLVYIFLAVIGAYCEISSVIELKEVGLTLLIFASIAVFLHGILVILLGSFIYRDWEMISIVSQANIGGGTTAIALAETFDRNELILPAILVGTLGNALGTYLGFLVVYIL